VIFFGYDVLWFSWHFFLCFLYFFHDSIADLPWVILPFVGIWRFSVVLFGGVSTIHVEYLRNSYCKLARRTNYSLHVALPFERYTQCSVDYPCRVPSRFPLQLSVEEELVAPRSPSVGMLSLTWCLLSIHTECRHNFHPNVVCRT
jgi:hypothetical protein